MLYGTYIFEFRIKIKIRKNSEAIVNLKDEI